MDATFWNQVRDNDYAIPEGHDLNTLTRELLDYLALPDPSLRIGIAYMTLGQWIDEKNLYSDSELGVMFDELMANLVKGLGDANTDSLFLRTFSLWVLTFILQRDMKVSFISEVKFQNLFDNVKAYIQSEQDFRGWVDEKGWAHTTAHIATILGAIAEHPHADKTIHERILTQIAELITRQIDHVYQHGEDDRLAQTVYAILDKNLVDIAFLRAWLKKLEAIMDLASEGMAFDIKVFNAYMNTRNLVRALYFPIELCVSEKPAVWKALRPALHDAIKEIGLC